MPINNARPDLLIAAIESVLEQIYPHWELRIAYVAPTNASTHVALQHYVNTDSRIKVIPCEKEHQISGISNRALELASGEWVTFLGQHDILAEHALYWLADAINKNPDVKLIYSDEDKVSGDGNRHDPYFKCDWNKDLFYSRDMISRLCAYRAALLTALGGYRSGLEGAHDYDLALRCIEHIQSDEIYHIPRILYRRRVADEDESTVTDGKSCAMRMESDALNEHFQRQQIGAHAEMTDHGHRVHYDLLHHSLVSLIIPTRNGLSLIQRCIESILEKTTYPEFEVIVVDNGSDDGATLAYFAELETESRIRVLRDEGPFNYSALNNAAVKLARGEVIGLLNNDLEVISPEWLSEMVSLAVQPGIGAVGASLWYPNDTLQHGGVILGIGGWAGHAHRGFAKGCHGYFGRMSLVSEFSAVTGACLVVRKQLYEQVGGLNESDLPIACNDVDFCLRLREQGFRNVWTPYAELYHYESATRGYEDTPERRTRFAKEVDYMRRHWGDLLSNDPAYSPNLTLDHEDFSLAWPPRVEQITS